MALNEIVVVLYVIDRQCHTVIRIWGIVIVNCINPLVANPF